LIFPKNRASPTFVSSSRAEVEIINREKAGNKYFNNLPGLNNMKRELKNNRADERFAELNKVLWR
jgi:hypothetical protein